MRCLPWLLVGLTLTSAVPLIGCSGDDTTSGGAGKSGAAGTGGRATVGSTGAGAQTTGNGTTGTGGGSSLAGGSSGGGAGGGDDAQSTGGSGGSGGGAGESGAAGMGGTEADDGGSVVDVPVAPPPTFDDVVALFQERCVVCHGGAGNRLDLRNMTVGAATLRQRLTRPLPNNQEGQCPVDTTDAAAGESGAADDATADGEPSDAGRRANWTPIVPNDLSTSFLYLKVTGTMPSPGCGARMPRVLVPADGGDGGDGGTVLGPSCSQAVGGAAANCLNASQVSTISSWILAGAP